MTYLNKLWRWQRGLQQSGYDKMLLCGALWPIKFDVYWLKFPEGSEIIAHTDKVATGKHYRLNFVLKNAIKGGEFICDNPIFTTKRIKFFRPDICQHQVAKVVKGNRHLLSVGWVIG